MTPPQPRQSVRSRPPGAAPPAEARAGQGGEGAQALLVEAFWCSDRKLRALAREQTAMRRVAALVAGDGAPDDLFALVAEEVAALLDADGGRVVRFGTDGTAVVVGSWRAAGLPAVPPGAEVGLDGRGAISAVRAGGRIARVERLDPEGLMRSRAAAAIHVGNRPWGALAVASRADRLPPEAEERLERFAEVVSLAVAGAEARRALRASERRFRSLTTHAPVGIFEADLDGRCLFVNERWCELTGLTPGAAIGREWSRAIHPEDRERVVGAWRRSAAAGVEFAGEHRYLTPDGRVSWVAERTVALHDEEGAPTGYMGTLTDVTERRRAEAAARRSARITRAVIEAVPAGISLIDPDGRVILANGAMDRWEEERARPAGRTIYERALASAGLTADPAAYRASVEAIRTDAAREALDRYELVGSGRSFERYTAPVRDGGGGLLGRLVVLREVTAEDRARRATDEFIALASHELRTPLTSILGYIEIMLEGDVGDQTPEQRRVLGVIDRNARRLMRLVGDLLVVARADAGRLGLELEAADVGEIASECVQAARPAAAQAGIVLSVEVERAAVRGDRSRLAQVVDNLLSNAVKFTPAGGRVRVAVRRVEQRVLVEVRDSGIGIPVAEQDRLFERFYRTSAAIDGAVPGTGLGLAISRMIVEAHGGRIDVRSDHGRGATFTIELPADPQGAGGAGAGASGSYAPSQGGPVGIPGIA